MAHDGEVPPDEERRSDRDWFVVDDKGRVREPEARRRRGPPLLGVIAGVVVLGVAGIAVANRMGATDRQPPSPTVSSTSGALRPPTTAPSVSVATDTAGPSIVRVGHPLLGVTGGWDLFALASGATVRIDMAQGRVVTTPVPGLASSGPVAFIAGPREVLIRPLDAVPGYVVRDGAPAVGAQGALATGGRVFPGPDSSHVWVTAGTDAKPVLSLVTLDGKGAGRAPIPIPPNMAFFSAQAGGSGSLVFQGTSGSYAANGDGLHRITTGQVVAASAHGWLVTDCDDRYRCSTALVDRATGVRHGLGSGLGPNAVGQISPDRRFAAVAVAVTNGWSLLVIDLTTGSRRLVPVALTSAFSDGALAWSPDSLKLLMVAADRAIKAVDPATGRVTPLGVQLPPVDQLAVRP